MYFVRTPYLAQKIYPKVIWKLMDKPNTVYLTFDDGPHPEITRWVLQQLEKYNAKATFFCLGKNVIQYPEVVQEIIQFGHAIANHGFEHLNGWKTNDKVYLQNMLKGKEILEDISKQKITLFRPPYGRIKKAQIKQNHQHHKLTHINWSLMPGDFDHKISSQKCFENLTKQIKSGDIICLHDSLQAYKHLQHNLLNWLEAINNKGLKSESIIL